MTKKKELDPNEILFGNTTRKDLDELAYMFLSIRIHNNLFDTSIPNCYRHSKPSGLFSEEFRDFEKQKFGLKRRLKNDSERIKTSTSKCKR